MTKSQNFLPESLLVLLGTVAASIVAQPIITTAINAGGKKVSNDTPYKIGVNESITSPLATQLQQSKRIMTRRITASMIPAQVSKMISDEYGLSTGTRLTVNSLLETIIGSLLEPKEKFSAANSKKFPLPTDLTKIGSESFFNLAKKYESTKGFGEKEFAELQTRQNIYNQNFGARSTMLFCRNTAFCAASVAASPMGKDFANSNVELFKRIGLNQEQAEFVSTMVFRASFAFMTTPFDSLVTKLSAGELPAKEILSTSLRNIKTGMVSTLFVGALARTILSTTTSSTIAAGPAVGEKIKNFDVNLDKICESFKESFSINPIYQMLADKANDQHKVFNANVFSDQLLEKIDGHDITEDLVQTLNFSRTVLSEETFNSVNSSFASMSNIGTELNKILQHSDHKQNQTSENTAIPRVSLEPQKHNPLNTLNSELSR